MHQALSLPALLRLLQPPAAKLHVRLDDGPYARYDLPGELRPAAVDRVHPGDLVSLVCPKREAEKQGASVELHVFYEDLLNALVLYVVESRAVTVGQLLLRPLLDGPLLGR